MSRNRARILKVLLAADEPLRNIEIGIRASVTPECVSELIKRLEFLGWVMFDTDKPRGVGHIRRAALAPFARQYVELLLPDPEEGPEHEQTGPAPTAEPHHL